MSRSSWRKRRTDRSKKGLAEGRKREVKKQIATKMSSVERWRVDGG